MKYLKPELLDLSAGTAPAYCTDGSAAATGSGCITGSGYGGTYCTDGSSVIVCLAGNSAMEHGLRCENGVAPGEDNCSSGTTP